MTDYGANQRMTKTRLLIARAVLALGFVAVGATAQAANELPGKGVTVQPLKSSLAEEAFQTSLKKHFRHCW
jgi:glycine betaine/proline transport system substrate-binding protein